MVRRAVVPAPEAGSRRWGPEARGEVDVGEGHEIWTQGRDVGLLEAREGERAWHEETGGGVGRGRGLMGVEGAAEVFWGPEAVAVVVGGLAGDL